MPPSLLLGLLVACLLALLPVWRLHLAGWSARSLFVAWLAYAAGIVIVLRFPGTGRFLVPILVLAVIAPFVAGPERLARLLGRREARDPGVIIDVTPRPPRGLPEPRQDAAGGEGDEGEPPPDTRAG